MRWELSNDTRGGTTPVLLSGTIYVGSVFRPADEPAKYAGRCTISNTPRQSFDTEAEAKAFVEAEFAAWLKRAQLGPT